MIQESELNLSINRFQESQYPTMAGIYHAAKSFGVAVEGTNLTDKLGLAGTLLIFPEFSRIRSQLQHVITLGHQIDHYFDSSIVNNPKALMNFNSLYPHLLEQHLGIDNILVKSVLGFFSQAMIVEKEIRKPYSENSPNQYRELINAVWVRMIVSHGTYLLGGNIDSVSFDRLKNTDEVYRDYETYINGKDFRNIPAGEKSYSLFLWTMVIQHKFDSMSRYRNKINGNPSMQAPDRDYVYLAANSGVNPHILGMTLKSMEMLPYVQKLQRF
jgi:hypothetical protein